jgi:hypothetical protein
VVEQVAKAFGARRGGNGCGSGARGGGVVVVFVYGATHIGGGGQVLGAHDCCCCGRIVACGGSGRRVGFAAGRGTRAGCLRSGRGGRAFAPCGWRRTVDEGRGRRLAKGEGRGGIGAGSC